MGFLCRRLDRGSVTRWRYILFQVLSNHARMDSPLLNYRLRPVTTVAMARCNYGIFRRWQPAVTFVPLWQDCGVLIKSFNGRWLASVAKDDSTWLWELWQCQQEQVERKWYDLDNSSGCEHLWKVDDGLEKIGKQGCQWTRTSIAEPVRLAQCLLFSNRKRGSLSQTKVKNVRRLFHDVRFLPALWMYNCTLLFSCYSSFLFALVYLHKVHFDVHVRRKRRKTEITARSFFFQLRQRVWGNPCKDSNVNWVHKHPPPSGRSVSLTSSWLEEPFGFLVCAIITAT